MILLENALALQWSNARTRCMCFPGCRNMLSLMQSLSAYEVLTDEAEERQKATRRLPCASGWPEGAIVGDASLEAGFTLGSFASSFSSSHEGSPACILLIALDEPQRQAGLCHPGHFPWGKGTLSHGW